MKTLSMELPIQNETNRKKWNPNENAFSNNFNVAQIKCSRNEKKRTKQRRM